MKSNKEIFDDACYMGTIGWSIISLFLSIGTLQCLILFQSIGLGSIFGAIVIALITCFCCKTTKSINKNKANIEDIASECTKKKIKVFYFLFCLIGSSILLVYTMNVDGMETNFQISIFILIISIIGFIYSKKVTDEHYNNTVKLIEKSDKDKKATS